MNTLLKIIATAALLMTCGITHAQNDDFFLQDRNKGFETKDGKGYIEMEIHDSTNIDSYIGAIYATLADVYPDAKIQTVGNRVIRMNATSKGIKISKETLGPSLFIDFSIMIEVREHPDQIYYYTDSLGVKHPSNDIHHVRIYAPVVKKCTAYCPYYKPEVKEYVTKHTEMHDLLMENDIYGVYGTIARQFISEISIYIEGNIRAELNQNYYRTFMDGKFEHMARKLKR